MVKTPTPIGMVGSDWRITFDPHNRGVLDRWLLTLIGHAVDVTVTKHKKRRTLPQNAWHWAVAVPIIAAAVGYEPDDEAGHEAVHYGLVAKCFGTTWNAKLKLDVPNVRSSKLTTEEFSHLMEWEVRYAAQEYGVYIPLPDELAA